MSSGPHAIHMEKRESMSIRTTVVRLRGHCCGGPSGVAAQSTADKSAATSVPPNSSVRSGAGPAPAEG